MKKFEATLGDPKALAASVSARKDVVLYGSEFAERYVGAAAKAQLAKWNLAFKVQGGIQAGVGAAKTIAWVAANVDASSIKNPKAATTPYQLFAIYEQTGADWQLVAAHFAFVKPAK